MICWVLIESHEFDQLSIMFCFGACSVVKVCMIFKIREVESIIENL